MQIVQTVYRELDPAETAAAVLAAFSVPGRKTPLSLVKILCALIWHETNGHPPGFGIGNVAAAGFVDGLEVSQWPGLAWRPPWFSLGENPTERNRAIHDEMLAGREPSAFRAYGSLGEALGNWKSLLVRKFPTMLEAAARGDVGAFARAYRDSGYCGNCDPVAARAALERRISELDQRGAFSGIASETVDSEGGGGILVGAAVVAVVVAVGAWIARRAG